MAQIGNPSQRLGRPETAVETINENNERANWCILAVLLGSLIYAYLGTLSTTVGYWENPKYSHGYLIPAFAAVLLWLRYKPLGEPQQTERLCGLGLLGVGLAMWLWNVYYPNITLEMYSLIPCLIGVFMMVGGFRTAVWAGPALGFLVFMFPLPAVLESNLLGPMQGLATRSSEYCLQTLGIACYSAGNTIHIEGIKPLGVVEQCSGLRMLTIFTALAVAVCLVTERPWWERLVIVASAIPIALVVNIARITLTALAFYLTPQDLHETYKLEQIFHDTAGWVMMPMALGLLYVEFQILSHLVIDESSGPSPIAFNRTGGAPRPATAAAAGGKPAAAAAKPRPAGPAMRI